MRQMEVILGRLWAKIYRLTSRARRFIEMVHRFQRVTEIEMSARLSGIEGNGLLAKDGRFSRCAKFEHRATQARKCRDPSWSQNDCLAACRQSLVVPTEVHQGGTEVGIRQGIVWLK